MAIQTLGQDMCITCTNFFYSTFFSPSDFAFQFRRKNERKRRNCLQFSQHAYFLKTSSVCTYLKRCSSLAVDHTSDSPIDNPIHNVLLLVKISDFTCTNPFHCKKKKNSKTKLIYKYLTKQKWGKVKVSGNCIKNTCTSCTYQISFSKQVNNTQSTSILIREEMKCTNFVLL